MNSKLYLDRIIVVIFVILIPLFIFGFNVKLQIFNFNFYEEEFVKNGVYDRFDKEIVDGNSLLLINYLESGDELNTGFFNEKEKTHLKDVKFLVNIFLIIFYFVLFLFGFFVLFFIYFKEHRMLADSFTFGGALTIVLLLISILFAKLKFNFLFTEFHLLTFKNELWLLDPAVDNLINLFPQQFFYDFLLKVLSNSIFLGVMFLAIGLIVRYKLVKGKFNGRN